MAFLKDKNKYKISAIVKGIDTAIGQSSGIAEFLGCAVVLVVSALLGTEIPLPVKGSEAEQPSEKTEG